MLQEQEVWKDIPGYEGLYQVSDLGNVKNSKWKIMSLVTIKSWYQKVCLYKNWIKKIISVHRLVWAWFLWINLNFVRDKNSICVLHKNDVRNDNKLSNLFLWTQKDNIRDMFSKWRSKFNPSHNWKKVLQFTKDWEFIREWHNMNAVNKELWIDSSVICKVCKWKISEWYLAKTAWGFIWKYSNN